MTNTTIQPGTKVEIAGNMFFDGKPRFAVIYKRINNKVCFGIGGDWWHVDHVTEVGV